MDTEYETETSMEPQAWYKQLFHYENLPMQ